MILVLILLAVIYSRFSSREEEAITRPYRNLIFFTDTTADESYKRKVMRDFHKFGAIADGVLIIVSGLLNAVSHSSSFWIALLQGALGFLSVWFTIWISFDAFYATSIGQKWFYLGDTADTDIELKKRFGKYAGIYKSVAVGILIAAMIVISLSI